MSIKVSVKQLREQLPGLLDRTVRDDDVCFIERDGEPYAVLVSIRKWRRLKRGYSFREKDLSRRKKRTADC